MTYDHELGQGGVGPSVRMCHRKRSSPHDARFFYGPESLGLRMDVQLSNDTSYFCDLDFDSHLPFWAFHVSIGPQC
jgi:hypothetical protein